MEELVKKENDIFEILQKLIDSRLDFILVGGYAVSAYKHRFSVDADIVVLSENLDKFKEILLKEGFKQSISKELENIYSSRFLRFEKDYASIDILVGALALRQTDACFSYELILENTSKRKIIGIEKEVEANVPSKEMLIVTKLHSGRLTDFRDVAALAKDADLNIIKKLLFIGDLKKLNKNLKELNRVVNDSKFRDSFKGVFMEKKFDIDFENLEKISKLRKD